MVMRIQVVTGRPAALRTAFAERVAELRREDPLAPITVLVGASLQRPLLQRWLAAQARRARERADPDARRPGSAARRAAARRRRSAGRCRRWPTGCCSPTSRASTRGTSRRSPRRRGSARRCSAWCGSCAARAMTSRTSARCWTARPTRPRRPGRWRRSWPTFEQRRAGFYGPDDALLAAEPGAARRARAARLGDARPPAGARARCCTASPSGCRSTSTCPTCPPRQTRRWPSCGRG